MPKVTEDTRKCLICNEVKRNEEFYLVTKARRNEKIRSKFYASYCRPCYLQLSRERYACKTPTERLKRSHSYSIKKFGLTPERYDEILLSQDNRCAICDTEESDKDNHNPTKRKFAVDHDHVTGEVRGLLCGNCNRGIGCLQDSHELVRKAFNYLNNHHMKQFRKAS